MENRMCANTNWDAVSALSTTAAVAVALGLALLEGWRRRADRRAQAKELELRASFVAASMTYRLSSTSGELAGCAKKLRAETNLNDPEAVLLALKKLMEVTGGPIFLPTPEEVMPLMPLEDRCAYRIIRGVDLIHEVRRRMTQYDPEAASPSARLGQLGSWLSVIEGASESVRRAVEICTEVRRRDAPMGAEEMADAA
jgi:hypothetical protein